MNRNFLRAIAVTTVMAPVVAEAAAFDIFWIGRSTYSLQGRFTFDDALIGSGAIDETDLDTFSITVFLGGSFTPGSPILSGRVAQGTALLGQDDFTGFNFNFDTTTETFLLGLGQNWNFRQSPVGFSQGPGGSQVSIGTSAIGASANSLGGSPLTAAPAAVPLPAAGALLFGALGLLSALRFRRRA